MLSSSSHLLLFYSVTLKRKWRILAALLQDLEKLEERLNGVLQSNQQESAKTEEELKSLIEKNQQDVRQLDVNRESLTLKNVLLEQKVRKI